MGSKEFLNFGVNKIINFASLAFDQSRAKVVPTLWA
jgi:hypothetical protein